MSEILIATLSLISVAISAVVTFALGRRKARADAGEAIATAAKIIADTSARALVSMEGRILALERESADLRAELMAVRARLREMEVRNAENAAALLGVATRATEQVARLSMLRDAEKDQLMREISRLRVMATGTEELPLTPWRRRDQLNGG